MKARKNTENRIKKPPVIIEKIFAFLKSINYYPSDFDYLLLLNSCLMPDYVEFIYNSALAMGLKILPLYPMKKGHHHHQQHVALPAQISLTLSRHPSLSPITPEVSSRLHPVSAQSYFI